MQSRFPVDYACPLCNRKQLKPTVCFSCTMLIARVVKAVLHKRDERYTKDVVPREFRVTDKYVEELHGSKILQELQEHDKKLRKEEFLERINNPKPKQFVLEHNSTCDKCYLVIPIGLGYCEEHNYSLIVLI